MHETTMSRAFAAASPLRRRYPVQGTDTGRSRARTQAAPENRNRVIRVTIESFDPRTGKRLKQGVAEIATAHAPAFRSAIDEIRGEVGGRLEGKFAFATEQALTDASVGLGAFAAAVNQVIPQGDTHYKTR